MPDIKLVRGVEKFSEKVMEVKIGINNDKGKFEKKEILARNKRNINR